MLWLVQRVLLVLFGGALVMAPVASARATPAFTDVTASVGLAHSRGQALPEACDDGRNCALPWAGTVAAEDVDGDGDLDLYFTMDSSAGVLYQNQGGVFVDVTAAAGLGGAPVGGGVSLVDLDGDGDRDLLINPISTATRPALRPWLYVSDGSTRAPGSVPSFVEVGAARGLLAPRRAGISGMGIAVGDYDLDGALDVYFADWRDRDVSCDVAGARLYRSARGAPGYFVQATLSAGVWARSVAGYARPFSFGGAFSDVDRDGLPDLLVTSDIASSELYWGHASGVFEPGGVAAGVATDRTGMGSTLADYDNDGDLDVFVSAIHSGANGWDGNRLYRHDGPRSFSDQTDAAGLRDVGWAWGAVFTDLDNDGDVDLCVTAGVQESLAAPSGYADDETKVFLNPGDAGAWEDVSAAAGVGGLRLGREVVALDYDADGDQDLLVVPHVGPPALLRNDAPAASDWVDVRVLGGGSSLEAIGAWVEARSSDQRTQVREVGTRAHFTGHGPRSVHFGLGAGFFVGGGSVDLHVRFPDGGELVRANIASSGTVTVTRAEASAATRAALPIPDSGDCDSDGFPDSCQADCDQNREPDVCQLRDRPEEDCDLDRVIDVCAVRLGFALDCDGDLVPDVCQAAPRCGPADAGPRDLGVNDVGAPDGGGAADAGAGDHGHASDAGGDAGHDDDLGAGAPRADLGADAPSADARALDVSTRAGGGMSGGAGCSAGAHAHAPRPTTAGSLALALLLGVGLGCRARRRRA